MKKDSGLFTVLALSLALASFGAAAQDDEYAAEDSGGGYEGGIDANDRRVYVSPMFSYTMADKDRMTDDGMGGTMSVGKKMTSGLNLELTGFFQQFDPESGSGDAAEFTGIGVGALIFPVNSLPQLYGLVALHQGSAKNHPTTPASTDYDYRTPVFDTGIGWMMPLTDMLGGFEMSLRLEGRYRMDNHTRENAGVGDKKSFYEGVANLGVLIPLGKLPVEETAAPVEVVEPAAPADTDGDGIGDDVDACPDTPAGTAVGSTGCEADTDGDGVPDHLDTCPDTAAGTAVNEQGCAPEPEPAPPVESGCRAPGPGEPINLEGCATGEAIVLRGVTFDTGSARLTANAKVILNGVADNLLAAPNVKVEIGGHTDSQGSDAYNQSLSEKRARSVQDYLVARGVPPERLSFKGYGESQPVDTNETADGREANRRVEMKIVQ